MKIQGRTLLIMAMTVGLFACSGGGGGGTDSGPGTDTPTTDVPGTDNPAPDVPVVDNGIPDVPVVDTPATAEIPATSDTPVEDTPATGACVNDDDQALLATEELRAGVKSKATKCGITCMNDADPVKCATPCVVKDTGLTEGCAGCYAGIINCTVQNCLAQCAIDPASEGCLKCQTENGCYTVFFACSGLKPS